MNALVLPVGKTVYCRITGKCGKVVSIRRVKFGLHRLVTIKWDDGTSSETYPGKLRATPPPSKS